MDKIFQIKLAKVAEVELIKYFDITRNKPDQFDKFYVLLSDLISTPSGFYSEIEGYGVYNSDHQLLGDVRIDEYSFCTVLSFFLKNKKHRQEFLDFIELTANDMKFIGFTVIDTREFGADKIGIEVEEKPYVPKGEKALVKWKQCYRLICEYREELADSDDWVLKPPNKKDMSDRIKYDTGISYTERTISDIIKAGEAGLLD